MEYTYDAWGNIISTSGNMASTLGADNPFRYRGYYYDKETGLYYLNARYYNPEWGRFINADSLAGVAGAVLSHNIFAYCENNPVMYSDPGGNYVCHPTVGRWAGSYYSTVTQRAYASEGLAFQAEYQAALSAFKSTSKKSSTPNSTSKKSSTPNSTSKKSSTPVPSYLDVGENKSVHTFWGTDMYISRNNVAAFKARLVAATEYLNPRAEAYDIAAFVMPWLGVPGLIFSSASWSISDEINQIDAIDTSKGIIVRDYGLWSKVEQQG